MSQGPDQYQGSSFLSVSKKKEALWNVVEPGDPYDIRKSMIAKIPFDKKTFMGDHLQLVCLFQAAEIQRLCEFLEDFKLRYRQVQRRELDRHSYEVQIKQLTYKLAQESVYREDNQKLREFIKNQSINKQEVQENIKAKYEKLLLQAKGFEDQNFRLKHQNQNFNYQMMSFDAKFEALKKSKQTEIDDIIMKMSQHSNISSQLELSSLRSQYESEVQRLDLENKRLKQGNQQKTRQIISMNEKYHLLEQELLRNSPKEELSKYQKKIFQYENRFLIFGKQIDRLNFVIKQISEKFEASQQKVKQYEFKYDEANKTLLILRSREASSGQSSNELLKKIAQISVQNQRLKESGKLLQEFQVRLRDANDEIIRLSSQSKIMHENENILKSEIQKYQYEVNRMRVLQKELLEYRQIAENNELKIKIAQDQNQVAILRQQVQRLHEELAKKQINLRNLTIENQNLQLRLSDSERRNQITVQENEIRMSQRVSEFESRIQNINRTKGYEFESKASLLQNQVQRLNEQVRRKTEEVENYQKQIRELEYTITNRYEVDTARRIQNYESAIQNLRKQNEDIIRRLRELEPLQRKVNEYENSIMIKGQEIQRLSQLIRNKDLETENLKRQIRDQQMVIVQRYEADTSRKITNYETNLSNLNRENQQLRGKNIEMNNKIALISQQIERLTNNLREFQFEIQKSHRRFTECESQLKSSRQQIERLNVGLRAKQQEIVHLGNSNRNLIREFQELGKKYNDLQSQVKNKFEVETNRVLGTLQQNIVNFKRENEELKRVLQEYEGAIKKQNADLQGMTMSLRNLAQQNENLKRQIIGTENSYRNILEVQVNGKYRSYETNLAEAKRDIEKFVRENTQLKKVLQNADQNNKRLNQQNQEIRRRSNQDFGEVGKRLNEYETVIAQLKNQNENLRRRIQELETFIKEKYEIEANRRISSLDQNLANAGRENEELRKRLDLTSRQLEEFRKIVQKFQRENEELVRKLRQYGDISRKFVEYENRISFLAQESQRTGMVLKSKVEDLSKADAFIKELTQRLQNSEKSISQSHSSIQQFEIQAKNRIAQQEQNINAFSRENSELKRKIPEYENKILILNQQLERINQNLKTQVDRSNQMQNALKNSSNENETLRRNIVDLQNTFSQKFDIEATRVIRNQEQSIEGLQRQNTQLKKVLGEYEQNLNSQKVDLQKLGGSIKSLSEENNMLRTQVRQIQLNISRKYESDLNSRKSVYEKDIALFKRQNQELVRKIKEFVERVAPEYQNQIAFLKQEIQRLNQTFKNDINQLSSNLKALSQENQSLKRQTFELQRNLQQISFRYESEARKGGSFEQNLIGIGKQNEELRRKLLQKQQEIEQTIRKINDLQYENEEIKRQAKQGSVQILQKFQFQSTQQINIYKQQITQMQSQYNTLQRQNEDLKRKLGELGGESNKVVSRYEEGFKKLADEIERLTIKIVEYENKLRDLGGENQALKRQARDSEISLSQKWQFQLRNKSQSYEQVILLLKRQNQELQATIKNTTRSIQDKQQMLNESANRRIAELQSKVALMSQEIQRLIQALKFKSQQNEKMHEQIERISHTLRIKLQESKQMQSEILRLRSFSESQLGQLQSNYTIITRENQNYKKHILEYENSIKKLYWQFERLQNIINELKRERQELFEKNYALSSEIDRLLNENKDLETQVEDVRLRLTDESALHKRINQHMGLMVVLFAEIESLRGRIKDKEKEVQDVRRSSLASFKLDRSRPKMDSM